MKCRALEIIQLTHYKGKVGGSPSRQVKRVKQIEEERMEAQKRVAKDSKARRLAFNEGYRVGIKEVVEWGEQPCPHLMDENGGQLKHECGICWQAQKKKWGVE